MRVSSLLVATALIAVPATAQVTLYSQGMATEGIPAGGPYVPPGSLYDNEQSNGTTSLVSQNSTGTFTARTADDFSIDSAALGCSTAQFEISQIRLQMVQFDTAPQIFAVDLFDDDGTGTSPTPAGAITPIATFNETSQINLGAFGVGTSIFDVVVDTPGLVLDGDTVYWISGFAPTAAANPAAFQNFFAASAGAVGTTDNGMIIAPGAGVATWTPADVVIGPPALAFSFAIDGTCLAPAPNPLEIPTASTVGLISLAAVLALLAIATLVRRRSAN